MTGLAGVAVALVWYFFQFDMLLWLEKLGMWSAVDSATRMLSLLLPVISLVLLWLGRGGRNAAILALAAVPAVGLLLYRLIRALLTVIVFL